MDELLRSNEGSDMQSLFTLYGSSVPEDCVKLEAAISQMDDRMELDTSKSDADTTATVISSDSGVKLDSSGITSGSSSSSSQRKFAARTNAGECIARLIVDEAENQTVDWRRSTDIDISVNCLNNASSWQYMFQKFADCQEAMEKQYSLIESRLLAQLAGSDVTMVSPTDVGHEQNCCTIGRIVCDSSHSKLSVGAVVLEASAKSHHGASVELEMSELSDYSVFPGQVVAAVGSNPTGRRFLAKRLVTPQIPTCAPGRELSIDNGASIDLIIACGPFSLSDSREHAALLDLMRAVCQRPPHALLLAGPLFDSEHSLWRYDTDADQLVAKRSRLLLQLAKACRQKGIALIVQSSCREIGHHCVYPTPPYSQPESSDADAPLPTLVPDPAMLQLQAGCARIAMSCTDWLAHLSAEEISQTAGSDRLSRLAMHALAQGSHYPLMPASESVPLDLPLWGSCCQFGNWQPNLLVAASQLKPFVKFATAGGSSESVCILNPGRLLRSGDAPGSYARVRFGANAAVTHAEVLRI